MCYDELLNVLRVVTDLRAEKLLPIVEVCPGGNSQHIVEVFKHL